MYNMKKEKEKRREMEEIEEENIQIKPCINYTYTWLYGFNYCHMSDDAVRALGQVVKERRVSCFRHFKESCLTWTNKVNQGNSPQGPHQIKKQ